MLKNGAVVHPAIIQGNHSHQDLFALVVVCRILCALKKQQTPTSDAIRSDHSQLHREQGFVRLLDNAVQEGTNDAFFLGFDNAAVYRIRNTEKAGPKRE